MNQFTIVDNQEILPLINLSQMSTIRDILRYSISLFNQSNIYFGHGYENATQEAWALILASLNISSYDLSEDILLNSKITDTEKNIIQNNLIQRIVERKPLSYITKKTAFAGLEFYVDERVIIPRSPINEVLKSKIRPLLKKEPQNILDLCTGSGCIAICAAYEFEEAYIDAIDISVDAINISEINIYNHQLENRVFPILSDLFESIKDIKYDLIISNPPYVDRNDIEDMPTEYSYEPMLALEAGENGLEIAYKILQESLNHLNEDGILICEVGNSMIALQKEFPELDFKFFDLENGGDGVFYLTQKELQNKKDYINSIINIL
ncbi:MAG: 50S ribosomal protein L3 N(5)-glutamine methyltransferase [Psittacicella sp.]